MSRDRAAFVVVLALIVTVQVWLVFTTTQISESVTHQDRAGRDQRGLRTERNDNESVRKAALGSTGGLDDQQLALSSAPSTPAQQHTNALTFIYERFPLVDIDGLDIGHIETKNLTVLEQVCTLVENCRGFNSNGWLKASAENKRRVPSQGTLFVKTWVNPRRVQKTPAVDLNTSDMLSVHQHPIQLSPSAVGTFTPVQLHSANDNSYLPDMRSSLKIFVYDDAGINDEFPWVQDYKYAVDQVFTKLLLDSPYLTTNPAEATFFMIPLRCTSYRKSVVDRKEGQLVAEQVTKQIVDHIKTSYPYWNRTLGADHFYVCGHDMGASVAAQADPNLRKNAIALVNTAEYDDPFFVPHKDISLPAHVGDGCPTCTQGAGPDHPAPAHLHTNRPHLAMFAGNLQRGSVRQQIHSLFYSDPAFKLVDGVISTEEYHDLLQTSKFCLAPHGHRAWSPRLMDAVWFGCIPVIVADHYHLPLTGLIDWTKMSVVVSESKISQLKDILLDVVANKQLFDSLQSNLWRERTRFVWSDPPVEGDAFDSVLSLLWQKRHAVRY